MAWVKEQSNAAGMTLETSPASTWDRTGHFTWTITSTVGSSTTETSFPLTITFSEELEAFEASDLIGINCTLSNVTYGNPLVAAATCTPNGNGIVKVYIPYGSIKSSGGGEFAIGSPFVTTKLWADKYSVLFDGGNQYVDMGSADLITADDYSISVWFKTSTEDEHQTMVSQGNSPKWQLLIQGTSTDKNKVHFEHYVDALNNAMLISDTASEQQDGEWHHCAITADRGGVLKMYLDKVLQTSTPDISSLTDSILDTSRDLVVGSYSKNKGTKTFTGNLNDVAIWSGDGAVLSAADVAVIYDNGPVDLLIPSNYNTVGMEGKLVGYWRMGDEDTHPTIADNSSNNNNGTMTSMVSGDIVEDTP